jgi:hypothetical protein
MGNALNAQVGRWVAPRRQYQMDTVSDGTQSEQRPAGQGAPARSGQSGEGSRSAMELLIQQEKKRDAQLPRENGGPGEASGPAA